MEKNNKKKHAKNGWVRKSGITLIFCFLREKNFDYEKNI